MKTYTCKTCGANMLINDNESFTSCLYCGNNVAIYDKTIDDLNVKKIIPFEIDKEEAIKNFKTLFKKNVLEAKKVYVPVRFCNYDFDFLIYYQYEVVDSDDNSSYYNTEDLIDGMVKKDIVFGNSKISSVYYEDELREKEKYNFDPVLLKDVSIEYSSFESREDIMNKIDSSIYQYALGQIKRDITQIYSLNYYTSDLDIDDYSTLIPVYIVKTTDGLIYNIPGVKLVKALKKKKKKNIMCTLLLVLVLIFIIYMFTFFNISKDANFLMVFFSFAIAIFLLVHIITFYINKFKSDKTYDNFEYTRYTFGDKRKNIK